MSEVNGYKFRFPRKLYRCAKCRSMDVAWWLFPSSTAARATMWKLVPATINPAEGAEKGWINEDDSPVWLNPAEQHVCKDELV